MPLYLTLQTAGVRVSYFLVFLSTLAADYAWTKYNMHSAAKRAHPAAIWSCAIILCGAFNVVAYTSNHWLLIPAVLGAYAGTWVAVRHGG